MAFGCDHGVEVERACGPQVAAGSLACIGQLPPAFIDYVLSRDLADGVLLTGCADGFCLQPFRHRLDRGAPRGRARPAPACARTA